jgi:hypothetical protein
MYSEHVLYSDSVFESDPESDLGSDSDLDHDSVFGSDLERESAFEIMYEQLLTEQTQRREALELALKLAGVEMHYHESLCQHYILFARYSLDYTVHKMCQIKYLIDYHDFDLSSSQFEDLEPFLEERLTPKYWPWKAEPAARIIQRNCYNWLAKPITKDNKLGIMVRLGMKDANGNVPLYPSEHIFALNCV